MISNYTRRAQRNSGEANARSRARNCYAGTLAEFGPALFILLILIFFPVLDLVAVSFAYGVVQLLNQNQVHEASLIAAERANDPNGVVKKGIPDQWQQSGLGKFVNTAGPPKTDVSYRDGLAGSDGKATEKFVIVKTSVVCNPLVFVPFPIAKVPGLNTPVPLTFSSERPMEDPDNAP